MNSRRSPVVEIPRAIRKQEAEIESIYWSLTRFGDGAGVNPSQYGPDDNAKQEVPASILITVLGMISIIGFYLLWLKT
jgi:hypothetical protein